MLAFRHRRIARARISLLATAALLALAWAPGARADERPFTIGVTMDVTGAFSSFGKSAHEGVELALKTWKQVKGNTVAGRPINVIYKDVQSNSQVAVSAFIELINNEGVDLIIGPEASDPATAVVPSWKQSATRPVWMLPAVTSTKAENLIGDDPYFFHGYGWAYAYSDSLVGMLKADLAPGHNKIALLYSDGAYGRSQHDDAKAALTAAGYNIVSDQLMREGSPDIGAQILQIRRAKPDAVYVTVQTGDGIQVTKQFYQAKLDVPYFLATATTPLAEWQNSTGEAQKCWTGMTAWLPGLGYPADKKEPALFPDSTTWEATYRKEFGHDPEYLSASHYAMTLMALLAVEHAGSADREKFMTALAASDYMTPYGPAKFEKSRIAVHNSFQDMLTFQRQKVDGAFRSVVVYPPAVAQGKLQTCN